MSVPMRADDVEAVLDFWFGDEPDPIRLAAMRAELWWSGSAEMDVRIAPYADLREQVIRQHADAHAASAREQLVRVLLVDQFSRALFRGTPAAFEHDALARKWMADGIAAGLDQQLLPIQRVFFYLPLEHSEQIEHQAQSVARYQELLAQAPPAHQDLFQDYLGYAEAHSRVIAEFGRFPHRNRILGRPSTDAELAFLQQPGSSF